MEHFLFQTLHNTNLARRSYILTYFNTCINIHMYIKTSTQWILTTVAFFFCLKFNETQLEKLDKEQFSMKMNGCQGGLSFTFVSSLPSSPPLPPPPPYSFILSYVNRLEVNREMILYCKSEICSRWWKVFFSLTTYIPLLPSLPTSFVKQ